MTAESNDQVRASDPSASAVVVANAGSGKTSTLVKRVARLLLNGARPEAILCVTYTKAGAAEMQRRLFQDLGAWAVMDDDRLSETLAGIEETGRDLSAARALFARALETPGGLKIQTIHAFCEKLLRRFPLEAGVLPGFKVLEDAEAAEVSARARDEVAGVAMAEPGGDVGRAYAHLSVELDWRSFNAMFATFEAKRAAIADYVDRCGMVGGYGTETWRLCGFDAPTTCAEIEADARSRIRWGAWRRAAEALLRSPAVTDQELGAALAAVEDGHPFSAILGAFSTKSGTPRSQSRLGTKGHIDQRTREWLAEEQARHLKTRECLDAAAVATDTVHALSLAIAYAGLYEGEKSACGALDFSDLIARVHILLRQREDAAWVLFKLDGGLEHILLDEAQDTAPEQWDILRALAAEFFSGSGAGPGGRTMFAVGDPKQSIFSFQGADPKRLGSEGGAIAEMASSAGANFVHVGLTESWRSTRDILSFVDSVASLPEILAGLTPSEGDRVVPFPGIRHIARRPGRGCVELWPLEQGENADDVDPWVPVDAEPPRSANKCLAQRVARAVRAMVERRDAVSYVYTDPGSGRREERRRPCRPGDMLILVRRRGPLFHEILRALKREGVPVSGADRLKLSGHGVFQDLMAIGRFTRFQGDDLNLAALLRSPFCDVSETSLFDLAHGRAGPLWLALSQRRHERPEWRSAFEFLAWARDASDSAPPFDFYGRILARMQPLDGDEADLPRSAAMRQRILTRLGDEGVEALDAFVAQALVAEARGIRDLESFLAAMEGTELEIKREPDDAHSRGVGEVRVMTVHGAKGLEAPVVIMPDTAIRARAQREPLLETEDGAFIWAPRPTGDCKASALARRRREVGGDQESARLLYVALTRARDRLIVCGVKSAKIWFERSWYDYVERAFSALRAADGSRMDAFALEGGGEGWRYGLPPGPAEAADEAALSSSRLPDWSREPVHLERPRNFSSPSSLGERSRQAAPSPLSSVGGLGRYRRGNLIHRLLQRLPDLPPDGRRDAAALLLEREPDLAPDQSAEIAMAALSVLADERFAAVFGPGSRAEVPLIGTSPRLGGRIMAAQVDRLVRREDKILVVDFKTNRPAPRNIERADPDYILQMAIYCAILEEIYPGLHVEAALVWTDGPALMPVPEAMMRDALAELPGA